MGFKHGEFVWQGHHQRHLLHRRFGRHPFLFGKHRKVELGVSARQRVTHLNQAGLIGPLRDQRNKELLPLASLEGLRLAVDGQHVHIELAAGRQGHGQSLQHTAHPIDRLHRNLVTPRDNHPHYRAFDTGPLDLFEFVPRGGDREAPGVGKLKRPSHVGATRTRHQIVLRINRPQASQPWSWPDIERLGLADKNLPPRSIHPTGREHGQRVFTTLPHREFGDDLFPSQRHHHLAKQFPFAGELERHISLAHVFGLRVQHPLRDARVDRHASDARDLCGQVDSQRTHRAVGHVKAERGL